MLEKKPKSFLRRLVVRGAKLAIACEVGCCVTTYLIWRNLNTSQDYRLFAYKNFNWILEGYYKVGETISPEYRNLRQLDLEAWREQGEI